MAGKQPYNSGSVISSVTAKSYESERIDFKDFGVMASGETKTVTFYMPVGEIALVKKIQMSMQAFIGTGSGFSFSILVGGIKVMEAIGSANDRVDILYDELSGKENLAYYAPSSGNLFDSYPSMYLDEDSGLGIRIQNNHTGSIDFTQKSDYLDFNILKEKVG